MVRRVGLTLFFAAMVGTATPVLADPFRPSKKQQVQLGQRAADTIRREEKVLPDKDIRVVTLRRVAAKLMAAMPAKEMKEWQFSFDVVESKEVNAYALPGGPIFFYTGLLEKLKSEDELAGVLGHEMIHVTKQHWASAYADNTKRKLGLGVLLMLVDANQIAADLANLADDLVLTMPYNRRHETESDDFGLDAMVGSGYNPEGMANVFRMLGKQGGGKPPEWLSTHPEDKNRVKRIEERAAKMNRTFPKLRALPWARTSDEEVKS